jgi:hypothetical protein
MVLSMANEKTQLEQMETEVDDVLFGKVKGLGTVDKSMLERSPTNKLIWDSRQSELHLATKLLYRALYALDNTKPEYERVHDDATGGFKMKLIERDNWEWLLELEKGVLDNQLTIRGYSRSQHLRQNANAAGLSGEDDEPGFWARLFR